MNAPSQAAVTQRRNLGLAITQLTSQFFRFGRSSARSIEDNLHVLTERLERYDDDPKFLAGKIHGERACFEEFSAR